MIGQLGAQIATGHRCDGCRQPASLLIYIALPASQGQRLCRAFVNVREIVRKLA